ncbi:MAG: hypothetical protein NTU95_04155 [Methanothrix sp.]|nr:hypothetical protein [Methanothrix sp.]
MNPKIAVSILMLLALSWPSVGTDYFYLGNGIRDQVINLDAGAKLPGQNYQFTRSGFVMPSMPQPMALSPNMMIKAGAARDESVSARDEIKTMYNETKSLLDKTDEKEQNIQSLLKRAESGTEASATNAAQAGVFFNKTDEAYGKTLALSTEVEGNVNRMKSMLGEARGYADSSAESAGQASESQNRTYLLHNETAVIFSQSSAVYNNMTLLAKEIQANSDNIF